MAGYRFASLHTSQENESLETYAQGLFINLKIIDLHQPLIRGLEIISNKSSFAGGSRDQYIGRELHLGWLD